MSIQPSSRNTWNEPDFNGTTYHNGKSRTARSADSMQPVVQFVAQVGGTPKHQVDAAQKGRARARREQVATIAGAYLLLALIAFVLYGEYEKTHELGFLFGSSSVRWALIATGAQMMVAQLHAMHIRWPVSRLQMQKHVMRVLLIKALLLTLSSVIVISYVYFTAEDISPLRDPGGATIHQFWRKMVHETPARVGKFQKQHNCTASECGDAVTAQMKGNVLPFLTLQVVQLMILGFDMSTSWCWVFPTCCKIIAKILSFKILLSSSFCNFF